MPKRHAILLLLIFWLCLGQTPAPDGAAGGAAAESLPWPVRLGGRVLMVDQAVAVVDRVVLVPDAATYLDELAKWSPRGRWPVLIEDELLAPIFIRGFDPAQIVRRESVGSLPAAREQRERACEEAVVATWGGNPGEHSLVPMFEKMNYRPPGVVVASVDDPAWTAAVALAAGRIQPLLWVDDDFRSPNQHLSAEQAGQVCSRIESAIQTLPFTYREIGDDLDTITLCRSVGGRTVASPFPVKVTLGNLNTEGPLATTDLIGRRADGHRYAFTGWIFGSEIRGAYVAMCSLFLSRHDFTCYNTYPDKPEWAGYGMAEAVRLLQERKYQVQLLNAPRTTVVDWRRRCLGGWDTDVLFLNSKGMANFFELAEGVGFWQDVPVLNTPAAVHMIHSWSMRSPETSSTIGGRWLDRGVYAYVGAAQEPYLGAFVPPNLLAGRLVSYVPMLIAARQWQGPVSLPWRVHTYGDPLMLCGPPLKPKPRLKLPVDYGIDLTDHITALLRASTEDPSGQAMAAAMTTLVLMGRDESAMQLWQLAGSEGLESLSARAALGPLFRMRQEDQFLAAWSFVNSPDDVDRDMLWHLLGPRLTRADEATTLLLLSNIRRPGAHADLDRLAPTLRRHFGVDRLRGIIQRELEQTEKERDRKDLQKLLQKS